MDTSAAWLFLSLAIGAVGAGLFIYGKKQGRWPQLACGVILCIYPYFVSNVWVMVGIAFALVAALWVFLRFQP
jgi:hypothetical protein